MSFEAIFLRFFIQYPMIWRAKPRMFYEKPEEKETETHSK